MAEERNEWQDFLAGRQHEITRAFRELHDRWDGIWSREQARFSHVGQEWTLAAGPDGRLTYGPVPKPFEETRQDLQQALDTMRETTETRLPWEAYSGHGSYMSGPSPELQTHDWMPERGSVAYVEWAVRDAIRTGIEEGRPLRAKEIETIRQAVWEQEILNDPRAYHNLTGAEQDAYEAQRYDRLEDQAHGLSPAEELANWQEHASLVRDVLANPTAYYPDYTDADQAHFTESLAFAEERIASIREQLGHFLEPEYSTQHYGFEGEDVPGEPERTIEIDTSDPEMGASWQQTLAQLQARLESLERDFPGQHRAQGHSRDEGMGY